MGKVTVSFTLDTERDRDILRWLERCDSRRRSAAIRDALRSSLHYGGVTIGDVYQAVKALERKLQSGAVVATSGDTEEWDEPPDAAAALDALANL